MPELVFISRGEDAVEADLAAALAERVADQDAAATVLAGQPPPLRSGQVQVLLQGAPGLALEPALPDPARTILVLLAPPGSPGFEHGVDLAPRVGAVFHVNSAAVAELHAADVDARHLQLGYAPLWESVERSRVDLAVIADTGGYVDWPRTLRAVAAGSVVLHERALGIAPLVPGRHLFVAAPESLDVVSAALSQEPERLEAVGREALRHLRDALPMDVAAAALVGVARGLVAYPTPGQPAVISK